MRILDLRLSALLRRGVWLDLFRSWGLTDSCHTKWASQCGIVVRTSEILFSASVYSPRLGFGVLISRASGSALLVFTRLSRLSRWTLVSTS